MKDMGHTSTRYVEETMVQLSKAHLAEQCPFPISAVQIVDKLLPQAGHTEINLTI